MCLPDRLFAARHCCRRGTAALQHCRPPAYLSCYLQGSSLYPADCLTCLLSMSNVSGWQSINVSNMLPTGVYVHNVYTDVSMLQVVHAALRDRGLGHAGVQQHQQLPRLRAGRQDHGSIITSHTRVRGLLSLCSSSAQVNTVSAGVCDYLYGRDVDSTGKFCAGGAVDACQVRGDWSLDSGDDCGITIIIGFD